MGKFITRTITIGFVLCGICFVTYNFYDATNIEDTPTNKINQNNNMLSMMLETDSGSGQYEKTSLSSWPTEGYVFNSELSKCEQGSILRWDDANKKVIMKGNVSDKCYVYFDKYNPIKINSYSITPNGNKITISISATSGTGTITKYFYSKDDGLSYVESTSNTYTFTNLAKGTYKIKAYVLDSNNKISEVISKNIEITSMSLNEYVMSQYTGTQGENNIYHHDSNLANGAGDNSYRYAGANPNNYVCFGSDESTCPDDNLYRIIGVFDGRTKLIKADYATSTLLGTDGDYGNTFNNLTLSTASYKGNKDLSTIGAYYWNYKNTNSNNNGMGINTWSTSLLYSKNLNSNYLNNIGSKWTNMIDSVVWKVGGSVDYNLTKQIPQKSYEYEIISPVSTDTVNAKIGLMYISDYSFAASKDAWNSILDYTGYGTTSVSSKNWLYLGLHEWTITRNSMYNYAVNNIQPGGGVYGSAGAAISYARDAIAVRPTLYLNSSINYLSGEGTKTNSIRISAE